MYPVEVVVHCPGLYRRRINGSKVRMKQAMPCDGQVPVWALLPVPERIKLLAVKLAKGN